nr:heparinase II/III family protein [uncultured Draconibacterium sp.]
MELDRRRFLKRLASGSAGVVITGTSLAENMIGLPLHYNFSRANDSDKGLFPFFRYMQDISLGNFFAKDQGGKFIQMQLINSEDDSVIVESIRNGLIQGVLGEPISWAKLEKTELEKSVWLNRFYYLPPFARIYYLTKDQSYLEDMMTIVRLWIKDNPRETEHPTSKYNWYDMQVAWRAIHFSWCYFLGEDGLSEEDKMLLLHSLEEHAEVLAEGFGKATLNEFNHQAHGALAMLYLGVLFPGFHNAKELTEGGIHILEHHIIHAFYNDGGNVEQMFGYYPFEACIFRDAYLLCTQNGITPPANIVPLLEKMEHYLSVVAQPDDTMPPVNDSYPMPTEVTVKTISEILNTEKTSPTSFYFPDTQIGVMRSGTSEKDGWYILANPAKLIGSHAHAGRLGFVAWFGQQPLFIESGCNSYDDSLLVKWYRTSRAHNTVIIDGQEDEATSSDIQWAAKRQTENHITDWIEKENYRMVRMFSPSTEESNNAVNWTRNLTLIRDDYMLIYDYFNAKESHDYEILLHLPPVEVAADKKNKAFVIKSESLVGVMPFDAESYSEMQIAEGYISVEARDVLAPLIMYKTSGQEKHSVLLATPVKESVTEFKLKQEIRDDGIVLTIRHVSGKEDIILFRKPDVEVMTYGKIKIKDWMTIL